MIADSTRLELWGGHECTVSRVGEAWTDQTVLSGHQDRLGDLSRFAELGVSALRYPVLWERVSPHAPDLRDWTWSDERLAELKRLDVRPIVGLIHHGSGPAYTSLLDPAFAEGLAAHARATAERYPWVRDWTPVNEPLTTARFSALYGHWYPHLRDESAFWIAFLNQIDAVRLSMRAIREIAPQARLVQTEDLGHVFATPPLKAQAEFENLRRWATWDLLTGRVTPKHGLWTRIAGFGLERRLRTIAEDPCPPDVVGVNHYLTSERMLDHRLSRYPAHLHGEGGQRYVDVEAVRVLRSGARGPEALLRETWERYGRPIAVTEAHNGSTRDEQMRWFAKVWTAAEQLRREGAEVEAVTAWALLGSFDWDSLLTRRAGHYEAGPFDLRGGTPRPTAAARLLTELARGQAPSCVSVQGEGWWRRDIRFHHPVVDWMPGHPEASGQEPVPPSAATAGAPILITGATGTLGGALAAACRHRNLAYVLTDRAQLDLADPASIATGLDRHQPWAVINAAGWVRVDDAEHDPDGCLAANAGGAIRLAAACAERDLPFVAFSSDLVFDGTKREAYLESDAPAPLNVYGRSKALAEAGVLAAGGRPLVIRTAAFFSPHDPHNFAAWIARELAAGRDPRACADAIVTPSYVPDLCDATLDLLLDREQGLRHLSNGRAMSWHAFGAELAAALGYSPARVQAAPADEMGWTAARPANAALASEHGALLPNLDKAIARFAEGWRGDRRSRPAVARIESAPQAPPRRRRG